MKKYLLDTNIVSELRKTKPHGAVLAWTTVLRYEQVFLSAATIGELQVGVELSRRQDPAKAAEIEAWLEHVVLTIKILGMDVASFREWARLIQGKPTQVFNDAMLAATARVHGLVLATRNEADFQHFDVEIFNPFKLTNPR